MNSCWNMVTGHCRRALTLATSVLVFWSAPLGAQWRVDFWFGNAYNLNTPVTIEQVGQPEIRIDGHWSTRPWRPTWYYSARVAKWSGNRAWAFEYMHHKVYLDNTTPEVPHFRITNGVNNLLIERHWKVRGLDLGIGAGPAIAVPLSVVRGKSFGKANGIFGSRYALAGATAIATAGKRFKLVPYVYASFAAKATATRLRVDVADGHAQLNNFALHLQWGLSLQSEP